MKEVWNLQQKTKTSVPKKKPISVLVLQVQLSNFYQQDM